MPGASGGTNYSTRRYLLHLYLYLPLSLSLSLSLSMYIYIYIYIYIHTYSDATLRAPEDELVRNLRERHLYEPVPPQPNAKTYITLYVITAISILYTYMHIYIYIYTHIMCS